LKGGNIMERVTVNKHDCLFVEGRDIPSQHEIQDYPYQYNLRHSGTDWSKPATIEKCPVLMNHFGTLFSKKPLRFRKEKEYMGVYKWEEREDI